MKISLTREDIISILKITLERNFVKSVDGVTVLVLHIFDMLYIFQNFVKYL